MSRKREESGEWKEEVEVKTVISEVYTGNKPFATTSDVAEALDCTTETARRKLDAGVDRGKLERESVGANAVVWYASHDGPIDTDEAYSISEDEEGNITIVADDFDELRSAARHAISRRLYLKPTSVMAGISWPEDVTDEDDDVPAIQFHNTRICSVEVDAERKGLKATFPSRDFLYGEFKRLAERDDGEPVGEEGDGE